MYECAALSGQRRADYETTHLHGSLHATRPPVERPGQTHRDVIVRLPSAGLRAALRGRLQALLGLRGSHRAEGRGCGTSVKKKPSCHVVDANADATRLLATPRRHRADSRPPTTRDARARHRRDRTKKTRRRLRALLLRLAQVHRQVRDAAHHAEAQVVAYKY